MEQIKDIHVTPNTQQITHSGGALALNLSKYDCFIITLNANLDSLSLSGTVIIGEDYKIIFIQGGTLRTVTLPATILVKGDTVSQINQINTVTSLRFTGISSTEIQQDGVAASQPLSKASVLESETGTDDTKYLTPSTGYQGWLSWIQNKTISALNTTDETVVGAINELLTTQGTKIDTGGDGLTKSGTTLNLGGIFVNDVLLSTTVANTDFTISASFEDTVDLKASILQIASLFTKLNNLNYPDKNTLSEVEDRGFLFGDGQTRLYSSSSEVSKGIQLNLDNFEDLIVTSVAGVSSTIKGVKYGDDYSSNWGTISALNRYIPDIGWIFGYIDSNLLKLDNTTPFTPDADYEPATKKYVDDTVASGTGTVPDHSDEDIACLVTTSDGDPVAATGLTNTPAGGAADVVINGTFRKVSYGAKTGEVYWSGDGGTTARALGAVVAGDIPYLMGSILGWQLDTNDSVSYKYNS